MTPLPVAASRAWVAMCAALAIIALAAQWLPRDWFDWQPQVAATQPWRLWTAAWVHWSPLHLLANLAGCVAVAAFGAAACVQPRSVWAWLAAWPLTHVALAAQPLLLHYGGLSGVLHAGVAVAAWPLVAHARGRRRAIGWAVLAGLALKLALERPWVGPTQAVAGWDIAMAPLAHVSGALSGLFCAAGADLGAALRLRAIR